jgi:3-phenylpropionate/cinnamic acid dioxygenase small subunit
VTAITEIDLRAVESWVYREARLADEHDYDAWEALWCEDCIYWVPANGTDTDPERTMSIIYDNRSRIRTRILQLHTGKRHSQTPQSHLRRLVTNIELLGVDGDEISVGANFVVYEARERGTTTWAGRYEYVLRAVDGSWLMARKKVMLVGNDQPLPTLSFLI